MAVQSMDCNDTSSVNLEVARVGNLDAYSSAKGLDWASGSLAEPSLNKSSPAGSVLDIFLSFVARIVCDASSKKMKYQDADLLPVWFR
jgi:hypothetical protein